MNDAQILFGLQNNSPIVWRYICRNLKSPFFAILRKSQDSAVLSNEDWEDVFQDTCVILMENVKKGKFVLREGSTLFSYFVEIGKRTMKSAVRRKSKSSASGPFQIKEEADLEIATEEKQTEQDRFLDRVFDSIPDSCKILLKKFYWDHKPMSEIASILGMQNADSVKTKKNRCMDKFKEIANKLVANDEFAEEVVRAAVERAALRELLNAERTYAEAGVSIAACKVDEEPNEDNE